MIKYRLKIQEAPTEEPVTLAEMRIQLHLDSDLTAEDSFITAAIIAARQHVEAITARALITQTWEMYFDQFPAESFFLVPCGNLQSINSIKIKNSAGEEETLSATTQYLTDISSDPGRVLLPYAVSWPSFTPYPVNPITVNFDCGYETAADVPAGIKAAIKLIAADLYQNREWKFIGNANQTYVENDTVMNLLWPYRLWDFLI